MGWTNIHVHVNIHVHITWKMKVYKMDNRQPKIQDTPPPTPLDLQRYIVPHSWVLMIMYFNKHRLVISSDLFEKCDDPRAKNSPYSTGLLTDRHAARRTERKQSKYPLQQREGFVPCTRNSNFKIARSRILYPV